MTTEGPETEIGVISDRFRKVMGFRELLIQILTEVTDISEVSARAIFAETDPASETFRSGAALCA